jgi:hypothetical protein
MENIILFNQVEKRILSLALEDDNRVQTHYSKEVFNCHYLPDIIQHLRKKLEKNFNVDNGITILPTEFHNVIKKDGSKARIGIYRISPKYKLGIRKLLDPIQDYAVHGSN